MKLRSLLLATAALGLTARAFADDNGKSITDALGQLDAKNDAHWTADGLPRIDTLKSMTGDQTLTRDAVEKANPGFNREKAGGENRVGGGAPAAPAPAAPPAPPAVPEVPADPMAAALADGWVKHPDAEGFHYKGQEVKTDAEVAALYAPSGGGEPPAAPVDAAPVDAATDISQQTGMGGATTARSPEPVEGELRKTHVSEPSNGEPGERPAGMAQGMTDTGANQLGTPPGPAESADRAIELSGEIQARAAGSTLTPTQAPADASNAEGISLGGAADPVVEARAPGGAVVAEGAAPATFFEGETVGGPFGNSNITAGGGEGEAKLSSVDVNFAGDPDAVKALEAELAEAEANTADLRQRIDELTGQFNTSMRNEAQLRRQIEANRPRTGNMDTIQTFLQASQARRVAASEAAKA